MSKTIVILALVCYFVAHVQCEPDVNCPDPANPGLLLFSQQVSTIFRDHISEHIPSSGTLNTGISCLVLTSDNNTSIEVVAGGVGFKYVKIEVFSLNWLQRSNYGIEIYVLQPDVKLP
ncbi:uncharacterized protein LOC114325733 [Diabrotica virgifera virgifera]|uniref:Salivary secreted peptide n=1 Tax=Diabrotica virgifera virgifera TaxID=50390 RepID=A0ABM5IC86_DIAVI|nr:uncharacterized protein LOC114325733 [Diabrotica virgifera virgifera]